MSEAKKAFLEGRDYVKEKVVGTEQPSEPAVIAATSTEPVTVTSTVHEVCFPPPNLSFFITNTFSSLAYC